MTTTIGTLALGVDDTWNNVFTNRNTSWADPTSIAWGVDGKFGLFTAGFFRFSGLSLPARSLITEAHIRGKGAVSNGADPLVTYITMLARDGRWNATTFTGWSKLNAADFKVKLLTTGAATMVNTLTGVATAKWEERKNSSPGRHQQLAQSVTITTGGTLGTAVLNMQKAGSPSGTGNIWVEIYSANGDHTPNALLATSGTASASSLANTLTDFNFAFTGVNQITLTTGVVYVVVLRSSYTIDGTNYAEWGYDVLFIFSPYAGGFAMAYGNGLGFDDQNYPIDNNMYEIAAATTSVQWNAPAFPAAELNSIDLKTIIQQAVNAPGYVDDGLMAAIISADGATAAGTQRGFTSFENGTAANKTRLFVTYRPRNRVHVV